MGNGAVHGSKSRIAGLYPDCTSERSELSKRIPDSGDSIQTIRQLCDKYGSRNARCQIRCQHFRKKGMEVVHSDPRLQATWSMTGFQQKLFVKCWVMVQNTQSATIPGWMWKICACVHSPHQSQAVFFSELLSWKEDDVHV